MDQVNFNVEKFPKADNQALGGPHSQRPNDFDPACLYQAEQREKEAEVSVKVLLLGDFATGKTALANRAAKNSFSASYKPTIAVDFLSLKGRVAGIPVHLRLWDTAGQERFAALSGAYYKGADVALLCYDVNRAESLEGALRWREILRGSPGVDEENLLLFLVGNKCDLPQMNDSRRIKEVCAELGAEPWLTSALEGDGIKPLFERVAALSFERKMMKERREAEEAGAEVAIMKRMERKGTAGQQQEAALRGAGQQRTGAPQKNKNVVLGAEPAPANDEAKRCSC